MSGSDWRRSVLTKSSAHFSTLPTEDSSREISNGVGDSSDDVDLWDKLDKKRKAEESLTGSPETQIETIELGRSIPGNTSYIDDEFCADSTDRSCLSKSFHIRAEGFTYDTSITEEHEEEGLDNWDLHPKKSSFRILLVRHAQSEISCDRSLLIRKADHAIDITTEGREQARQAGKYIKEFFTNSQKRHVRMWVSPYQRTRETAKIIQEECSSVISDVKENIFLSDQQFGLFEGIPIGELAGLYPKEYQHYKKCVNFGGKFWSRMPLGESTFDVCRRIHEFFGTIHRDASKYDICDLVIVLGGIPWRAFLMMWFHKNPEWFEISSNPDPCSIYFIENRADKGIVFPGFVETAVPEESQTMLDNFEQTSQDQV